MTTKTLDTTVSQLLQDNSSVEYVDSQENPIVTIPNNGLIFGQTLQMIPTLKSENV